MKTKTIFVLLMLLLSWIPATSAACACAPVEFDNCISQDYVVLGKDYENDYRSQLTNVLLKQATDVSSARTNNVLPEQVTNVSPSESSDLCPECGHSSACCSAQNSSAVSSAVFFPLMDLETAVVSYEPEKGFVQIPDFVSTVRATRAPPRSQSPTLVSSHQLLLI